MGILNTKKNETKAPEITTQDLTNLFKQRTGKGAFYYISNEEVHITATQLGMINKKINERTASNRPIRDLNEFLLSFFPSKLVDELEAKEVSLEDAYKALRQQTPNNKVSSYSRRMSQPERLARLVAGVAGHRSPSELMDELQTLISQHRSEAEALLTQWAEKNGRAPKGGYIRVNAEKVKK